MSKLEVMQKKNSRKEEGSGSALTRPAERGLASLPWLSNSQWGMQAPCKDLLSFSSEEPGLTQEKR